MDVAVIGTSNFLVGKVRLRVLIASVASARL